ncbi:hypothetical protein Gorai_016499, partial [Gossypium raimondii]|nr:hypothetical protein [Gossypium raimondii]
TAICPRRGDGVESLAHVFWGCRVASEVWGLVGLSVVLSNVDQGWFEWLTWVFNISSTSQCRIFCCTLWDLWTTRNKRIHEHIIQSGKEISNFIHRYICEIDGIEENVHTRVVDIARREPPSGDWVKINFDAAFDKNLFRLGSRFVAKNARRRVVASGSTIHEMLTSHKFLPIFETFRAFSGIFEGFVSCMSEDRRTSLQTIASKSLSKGKKFYLRSTVPRYAVEILEDEWIREPD